MKQIELYNEELSLLIELVDDALHSMLSNPLECKMAKILLNKLENNIQKKD